MNVETFYHYFEWIALVIEIIWVTVIFLGLLAGIFKAIKDYRKKVDSLEIYKNIRENIAHSILLWLEILIAVDIIKTVTTELTMENMLILGLLIIIRMILSISLEVEIENKFPWQKRD